SDQAGPEGLPPQLVSDRLATSASSWASPASQLDHARGSHPVRETGKRSEGLKFFGLSSVGPDASKATGYSRGSLPDLHPGEPSPSLRDRQGIRQYLAGKRQAYFEQGHVPR